MTALKRMLVPLDSRVAPPTVVTRATAFARTLGVKLHLFPGSDDREHDIVTEDSSVDPSSEDSGGRLQAETGVSAGKTRRARPPFYTLAAFAHQLAGNEGVNLLDLEPMTTLVVRTAHSVYRILVLQGTTVLFQGGSCFPDITIGHVRGSGFGGHLLKMAWIGVGLRMEISAAGKPFVTSAVRAIAIEGDPSTYGSQ